MTSGRIRVRLRWTLVHMGTDRREFLFFWEVQDILRPRALSPAHPDPVEASRTGRPERLSSFRLTFSLLSVSHLEKDRAASNYLSNCGIWGKSHAGS